LQKVFTYSPVVQKPPVRTSFAYDHRRWVSEVSLRNAHYVASYSTCESSDGRVRNQHAIFAECADSPETIFTVLGEVTSVRFN
jgi:hypothetical protein